MSVAALTSSRPVASVGLSALLVGVLALSGCSSAPKVTKTPAAPTATATAAAVVAVQPFQAKGMPAELTAVIKALYLGGAVASSQSAGKVLGRRKPVKAAGRSVVVSGAMGTWKGVPIAVVTQGKDVTLAVKAPRWKVVGGWWPSIGVSAPSLGGSPRRVLVVGSDARKRDSVNGSRADSLHIVGYDGHGDGGIVGIARDAYVPLATGGRGKINSALPAGGPLALQRTVSSATGVALEGYLITGFDGFRKLINGIGGLPVKVPVSIQDRDAQANIKAGARKLTGGQALAYGRARHTVAGGDFGRSANQGRLILAAGDLTRLAGPAKLPGILRTVGRYTGTNMTAEQVLLFAAAALVTNPKKVRNQVAAGSFDFTSDGQSIVLFDDHARRLFADIRDGNLS